MNSSSLLIVTGATVLGVSALFMTIKIGMNMSDEYASKLSVTSEEYLKLRAKAVAMGEDPVKIKDNAARSKRPVNYQSSLTLGKTSPYVRPDSDSVLNDIVTDASDVVEAIKYGNPEAVLRSINKDENSDAVVAAKAGLTEEELLELIEKVKKLEKEGKDPTVSVDDSGANEPGQAVAVKTIEVDGETIVVFDDEDTTRPAYTVEDEIRHQLATEEMSDQKRAMLESLLPKEKPKAVRAVNVILEFDTDNCVVPRNSNSLIGVMFRHESQAIRGSSLNELDELILLRERCKGKLVLEDHAAAASQEDIELRESRRDEVKYYLLQRRVPVESIVLSSL